MSPPEPPGGSPEVEAGPAARRARPSREDPPPTLWERLGAAARRVPESRYAVTLIAIALLGVALAPISCLGLLVRLLATIVAGALLTSRTGAWADVAVGLLLVLAVIAVVQVARGKGEPSHTSPRIQVALPSDARVAGPAPHVGEAAVVVAMVRGGSAGNGPPSAHEHEVFVHQLAGKRSGIVVTVERTTDDGSLDTLVDDLANATAIYLLPSRTAKNEDKSREESDHDRALTVSVAVQPPTSAPSVRQTTVLSLASCLGGQPPHRPWPHDPPPRDPPPRDPPPRDPPPARKKAAAKPPAAQSTCTVPAPRGP